MFAHTKQRRRDFQWRIPTRATTVTATLERELWHCSEGNGDGGPNLNNNDVVGSLISSEFGSNDEMRRIVRARDVL